MVGWSPLCDWQSIDCARPPRQWARSAGRFFTPVRRMCGTPRWQRSFHSPIGEPLLDALQATSRNHRSTASGALVLKMHRDERSWKQRPRVFRKQRWIAPPAGLTAGSGSGRKGSRPSGRQPSAADHHSPGLRQLSDARGATHRVRAIMEMGRPAARQRRAESRRQARPTWQGRLTAGNYRGGAACLGIAVCGGSRAGRQRLCRSTGSGYTASPLFAFQRSHGLRRA